MSELFTPVKEIGKNWLIDSVAPEQRGTALSITTMFKDAATLKAFGVNDAKLHDVNFAFLTTTLAKLHKELYEPLTNTTYAQDIPVDVGGGFVDYVSFYTVDWAGIMNEFNLMGNNANYIPRVNAGLSQKRVNVYTWEVAYDLRFVELEKMSKVSLQKSIKDIYSDAIVAGWDLFVQKVAYKGIQGATGLFNDPNVAVATIDNSGTTGKCFQGLSDSAIVSFFNGVFEYYLINSNMNFALMPDTFLVPFAVGSDLSSRINTLYTNTLRKFILDHNFGIDEMNGDFKITIASRSDLDDMGVAGKGRIVTYKKNKRYVRIDMPYPMQQYITLPNINQMSYTTAFVGQVSQVQLPYNTNSAEMGPVAYWDFTH